MARNKVKVPRCQLCGKQIPADEKLCDPCDAKVKNGKGRSHQEVVVQHVATKEVETLLLEAALLRIIKESGKSPEDFLLDASLNLIAVSERDEIPIDWGYGLELAREEREKRKILSSNREELAA